MGGRHYHRDDNVPERFKTLAFKKYARVFVFSPNKDLVGIWCFCLYIVVETCAELGHQQGRARPIWDGEGHRGFMLIEFLATRESLAEAERLHRHFEANGRGRKEWERVQPFWESHLEDDNADEAPEFVRLDETSEEKTNVFYGYLALGRDLKKFAIGKRAVKWTCVSKQDVLALDGPTPTAGAPPAAQE